jgi:hypothetical protein
MKVYILSAPSNILFAENLLSNIKNITIVSASSIYELGADISRNLKHEIESADAILAIIDSKFSESTALNIELQIAQTSVQKHKNKILIPVILDAANIPVSVRNISCIICSSNSKEDLYQAQLTIENTLLHECHDTGRENLEKKNSKTLLYMVILTIATEIFAMSLIALTSYGQSLKMGEIDKESVSRIIIEITSIITALSTLLPSYLLILKKSQKENDEKELVSYSNRLKRAIIQNEPERENQKDSEIKEKKEIDALGRMMINLEDIKEFYTWSQKQAKASFILAVIMCIAGFILVTGAILLPVIFKLPFQTSIIAAVGGVITELIAGTALSVYRNSLLQLNHYHKALHEDERFLSSVNLLGKFSTTDIQDKMLQEIIRSEIQMNLIKANENEKTKKLK